MVAMTFFVISDLETGCIIVVMMVSALVGKCEHVLMERGQGDPVSTPIQVYECLVNRKVDDVRIPLMLLLRYNKDRLAYRY